MNFRQWLEANWYHGSHVDFDQWDAESARKTSGRQGIDSIGQWLTSDPRAAKNYGPKIYQYDVDLKNPYQMHDHYFNRAFFFPEVAKKFLDDKELKIMSKRPEMEQMVALSKERQANGGWFNDRRDERRFVKLQEHIYQFDKIAAKLYRQTDYIKSLRDYLLKRGYDSILWKNSHIDFRDIEHDVAVLLEPQKYKKSGVDAPRGQTQRE